MIALGTATDWIIIYNHQLLRSAMQPEPERDRFMDVVAGNRGGFIRGLGADVQRQLVEDGYLFEEETHG